MAPERPTMVRGSATSLGTSTSITPVSIAGYRNFDVMTDGNQTVVVIEEDPPSANFEWLLTTKNSGGVPQLSRSAGNVIGGTAGPGSLTNFTGAKQVVYPGDIGEVHLLPPVGADPTIMLPGMMVYRTDMFSPRVYAGSTPAWVDLVRSDTVTLYRLDQFAAPTSSVSFNSQKLTNLADPTLGTDAATKEYVDATSQGLAPKEAVQAATAAVLPTTVVYANGASGVGATITAGANGALTVDGYTVLLNDRILVKNQAAALQNGIYKQTQLGDGSHPYILTRAIDADTPAKLEGAYTFVESGTVNTAAGFTLPLTTPNITIGTTALAWTQFSGAGEVTVDSTLLKSGNQISLNLGNVNTWSAAQTMLDSGTWQHAGAPTKQFQLSGASITAGQTRVLTVQDANYTLAGKDIDNVFSASQTIFGNINLQSGSTGITMQRADAATYQLNSFGNGITTFRFSNIGVIFNVRIGFFGHALADQPPPYSPISYTTSRSLNGSTATLNDVINYLATLSSDIQSLGLIG